MSLTIVFRFALLVSVLSGVSAQAESAGEQRRSYGFFSLGYDYINYEESTNRQFGGKSVDIETSTNLNFTQQSGSYVAISPDWGFYLTSASTLGNPGTDESWEIEGITVLTNKISFERQRIGIIASYRLYDTEHLLFGAQYDSNEFSRFGTTLTAAAASFGITQNSISAGTISEQTWDLNLVLGYESNTLFSQQKPGWQHLLQATIGLPLITSLTNTEVNNGDSFTENFNGFLLRLNAVVGYQFDENVTVTFGTELGYSLRKAIDRDFIDINGTTEFPENVLFYLYPNVGIYWSF